LTRLAEISHSSDKEAEDKSAGAHNFQQSHRRPEYQRVPKFDLEATEVLRSTKPTKMQRVPRRGQSETTDDHRHHSNADRRTQLFQEP
jgi:hypothetical protein